MITTDVFERKQDGKRFIVTSFSVEEEAALQGSDTYRISDVIIASIDDTDFVGRETMVSVDNFLDSYKRIGRLPLIVKKDI